MYRILQPAGTVEPERLKTGDELVVQVSKDAVKSKAPVVTERLSFTGRYCVLLWERPESVFREIRDASYKARLRELLECDLAGTKDLGVIVRTNAVTVEECAVREELAELMRTWQGFRRKLGAESATAAFTGAAGLYSGYTGFLRRDPGRNYYRYS